MGEKKQTFAQTINKKMKKKLEGVAS